jgi:beta-keto acid cleavage enzyme
MLASRSVNHMLVGRGSASKGLPGSGVLPMMIAQPVNASSQCILARALVRRSMTKLIITAALTGGFHGKEANPNLPITPDEIAQSAYECWQAGAAIVFSRSRITSILFWA